MVAESAEVNGLTLICRYTQTSWTIGAAVNAVGKFRGLS